MPYILHQPNICNKSMCKVGWGGDMQASPSDMWPTSPLSPHALLLPALARAHAAIAWHVVAAPPRMG